MLTKEENKEPEYIIKKNPREKNSYKIQYKLRKNKNYDNKVYQKSNKSNNNLYSRSNYSAKTFNQKPAKNLVKDNNDLDEQSLNNFTQIEKNAISYSNFSISEMNALKALEKNKLKIISDSRNSNNQKDNICYTSEIKNLKMDIKELSNSQNNNINNNEFNNKDDNNNFVYKNEDVKSIINNNPKILNKTSNNSNKILPDINKKNDNGLQKLNKKIKKPLSSKIFKKMNRPKKLRNVNVVRKFDFYNNNKRKMHKIDEEKNNYSEEKELNEIHDKNNYISNNQLFIKNKLNNDEDKTYEKNSTKNENNNCLLFNEIDEKFNNLYSKLVKKKEEFKDDESNNYIEESNNTTQIFRITYPNLKRYRQKSEPNLRIDMTKIKINDEINKDIAKIKYPLIKNCNTNLSKFKTLEETIKTENSNKRMITNLLNKQKNPELKEILSNLQNTINKFSKYEETKEYNYLSTLPANNLSPFEAFKFENKNLNNNNLNFKLQTFNYNYSTEQTNYNKKMEKFKSTFNDFKKIIQGKNKSKNILVNQQRNDNKNHLNTRIIYSSLSPVNNLENDIFILES